jgi:hypothetical protein
VWESTLEVPLIEDDLLARIVASPFKVESDSFYFVGEKLVMHNKARYRCARAHRPPRRTNSPAHLRRRAASAVAHAHTPRYIATPSPPPPRLASPPLTPAPPPPPLHTHALRPLPPISPWSPTTPQVLRPRSGRYRGRARGDAHVRGCSLFTVTFHANHAHNLTRSP